MLQNRCIASADSSMPSSILMSIIWAPSFTCVSATSNPASYSFSIIRRLNFADPVILHRSPMLTNRESLVILKASNPARRQPGSISGILRGDLSETTSKIALMCSGVVPQQPPTILTKLLVA